MLLARSNSANIPDEKSTFRCFFLCSEQASFNLKNNAGGDIVTGLTSAKAKRVKYGPSSTLSFETGNASSSVRASTVSGLIEVK
ncbi:hypothetical protein H4J38_14920 [Colwellia sp. BRX10-3]|uniref:hypothetical protein n=1 Tax=Colwellia sp. BRX10-3 TaxID=2759844 RepID=UPI0015F36C50|nr:hypothetical protein [Colwellia sp. BRX10-3]MBA6392066.1 hypothetical protein [Colwellia sp. BRX10-3]